MLAASKLLSEYGDTAPMLPILGKLARPSILALSGVLLVFRRKFAVYGFAIYIFTGLLSIAGSPSTGVIVSLLLICAFLAYSLHLWKAGRLR
ncbi:hypothetical protein GCM10027430_29130 [Lysobacter tyrosinilyticus]